MDNDCITPSFRDAFLRKNQFLRFLAVGILNTVFGYSLFAFFFYCGFSYVIAALLSTCLGILFNFRTLGKFVFNHTHKGLLWRFLLVYAITYFFGITIIKIGTYFLQNIYIIGAIGTPITAITAYLLNKHLVFHRTCHETH
jgi:putative flippase GtrA